MRARGFMHRGPKARKILMVTHSDIPKMLFVAGQVEHLRSNIDLEEEPHPKLHETRIKEQQGLSKANL